MILITFYMAIIFVTCALVLMSTLSLKINTIEQQYLFSLAHVFQVQYYWAQRGFRFSLFGYSWFKKLHWGKKWTDQAKGEELLFFLKGIRVFWPALRGLWSDLQRFSNARLDINLCTPDFMTNALLAQVLAAWQIRRIRINYLEENWLIINFTLRLWSVAWIFLKFALSWAGLRLGFFIIRSKLKKRQKGKKYAKSRCRNPGYFIKRIAEVWNH